MNISIRNRAFSLLEIAIVLSIIGVVTAGGLIMLTASTQSKLHNETVTRMEIINKAIADYTYVFGKLPCPASLTLLPADANYGIEAASNTNTCVGGTPAASFASATGTVEGAIPTATLRLPMAYMYDAWGHKFRYAMNPEKTAEDSYPPASGTQCTSTKAVTVNDASGTARTTNADYVLLSHGASAHGAYTKTGAVFSNDSANTDEQKNCHCDSAGAAATYDGIYVQKLPTTDVADNTNSFDDIVTYREAWQLQSNNSALSTSLDYSIYVSEINNSVIRKIDACGIITTIAGGGPAWMFGGDGGPATDATLYNPEQISIDSAGNLYITDKLNHRIRKIDITGTINTIAGSGAVGWGGGGYSGDGGTATSALLNFPLGVAVDSSGNVYIGDTGNHRIRKVTTGGIISTYAGTGSAGNSGDGGASASAQLNSPRGLAIDSNDNLYIADAGNFSIRKVTSSGIISTVAGNGTQGFSGDGGAATSAQFYDIIGISVNSSGDIYIVDNSALVRKVTSGGIISTVVGGPGMHAYDGDGGLASSAHLRYPRFISTDSQGGYYIGDTNNNVVRKVSSAGIISTFAGTTAGYSGDGGQASSAQMNGPSSVLFVTR